MVARHEPRWCWASASGSWTTTITPRTPSRPCSSTVLARRAHSVRDPDLLEPPGSTGVALADGAQGADPARGSLAAAGPRRTRAAESSRGSAPAAPAADRAVLEGERAEALHAEIDRLPGASSRCRCVLCYLPRPLPRPRPRRIGSRCPPGPLHSRLVRRPGEAPHRPDPLDRGRRSSRATAMALAAANAPIGLGVHFIPPVRYHHPGRDHLRGPTRRRQRRCLRPRPGTVPGGPAYHAALQAQAHRDLPAAPGRRRHRRRLARPFDGDEGGPREATGGLGGEAARRSPIGPRLRRRDPIPPPRPG